MRPGQAAPVFKAHADGALVVALGFNEAGAGCPGILFTSHFPLSLPGWLQ